MKYSDFYLAFENKFRGSDDDVKQKLVFYDGLLNEIISRFTNCNLLDIGSGRGEWLMKCSELGINSTGIDNNKCMCDLSRSKGLNMKFGDALDILKNLDNDSFHIISSFHFIEHISFDTFLEILEECKRILIPGGVLILETPSIDNLLVSSKDFYLDPTHKTHIHPETVIFALNYFGFTDAKYFLLNPPSYKKIDFRSINYVLDGAGRDVSIIATYHDQLDISLFDKSLDWINKIDSANNTLEVSNLYNKLMDKKIRRLNEELNSLNIQVENLLFYNNKIFNSFPVKLLRKIKSSIHLSKALFLRIFKLSLSKILRIHIVEKIYLKIFKSLFKESKNLLNNDLNDKDLISFFYSNPRSRSIFLDIKSKINL